MITKEALTEELRQLVEKNEKKYDWSRIEQAIALATKAHEGQRRSSARHISAIRCRLQTF